MAATTASSTIVKPRLAARRDLARSRRASSDVDHRRRERDRRAGHLDRLEGERRRGRRRSPRSVISATARVPERSAESGSSRTTSLPARCWPSAVPCAPVRTGRTDDRRGDGRIEADRERPAREASGRGRADQDRLLLARRRASRYAGSKSRSTGVPLSDGGDRHGGGRGRLDAVRRALTGLRLGRHLGLRRRRGRRRRPEDVRRGAAGREVDPRVRRRGAPAAAACAAPAGGRAAARRARRPGGFSTRGVPWNEMFESVPT